MSKALGGSPHLMRRLILSPTQASSLNPAAFNAKTYVQTNFPKIRSTLTEKATDIVVLAPAVDKDPAAAAKKYGTDVGSGKYAFPVKATGTVKEVDENFMLVAVPGVPAGDKVRIPLGFAITGTPVRDATGGMTFSDFSGQTDYQSVANELKVKIRADVTSKLDPPSLKGKKVTVVGAYSTGGPPSSFIIQPVSIEAS
jgi:predicted lipoprotein